MTIEIYLIFCCFFLFFVYIVVVALVNTFMCSMLVFALSMSTAMWCARCRSPCGEARLWGPRHRGDQSSEYLGLKVWHNSEQQRLQDAASMHKGHPGESTYDVIRKLF